MLCCTLSCTRLQSAYGLERYTIHSSCGLCTEYSKMDPMPRYCKDCLSPDFRLSIITMRRIEQHWIWYIMSLWKAFFGLSTISFQLELLSFQQLHISYGKKDNKHHLTQACKMKHAVNFYSWSQLPSLLSQHSSLELGYGLASSSCEKQAGMITR